MVALPHRSNMRFLAEGPSLSVLDLVRVLVAGVEPKKYCTTYTRSARARAPHIYTHLGLDTRVRGFGKEVKCQKIAFHLSYHTKKGRNLKSYANRGIFILREIRWI